MLEVWVTTWIYAVTIGILYYAAQGGKEFLFRQVCPILNFSVWFISVYLVLLLMSPALNYLLKSFKGIKSLLCILFIIQCIVPTFYPASKLRFGNIGWFCILYLIVGELKHNPITFLKNRKWCFLIFFICWHITVITYFYMPVIRNFPVYERILDVLGMYPNMYFADLSTLPCFLTALCLFYFFNNTHFNFSNRTQKALLFISGGTLDVYVLLALESPDRVLFWIELLNLKDVVNNTGTLLNMYLIISGAFFCAVLIGNIRKNFIRKLFDINRICQITHFFDSLFWG